MKEKQMKKLGLAAIAATLTAACAHADTNPTFQEKRENSGIA